MMFEVKGNLETAKLRNRNEEAAHEILIPIFSELSTESKQKFQRGKAKIISSHFTQRQNAWAVAIHLAWKPNQIFITQESS